MDIATIIFTYNRSWHTCQVLEALSRNTVLPTDLIIFQDGLKKEEDKVEWLKVKDVIHSVNWCRNEIVERKDNYGLASSIVTGIDETKKKYDAFMVLEDDCVPHPQFMEYMLSGLNKYIDAKEVYTINAYAHHKNPERNGTDAYFIGRASSWGWATWTNRWKEYEQDYTMLGKIRKDPERNEQYHIWGEDLESYLLGNIYGTCDSWATFWALKIIEKGGYCLTPYESFVSNIGFDGTGVHCGKREIEQELRAADNRDTIILPDQICFPRAYKSIYRDAFSWVSPETKAVCYNKILTKWTQIFTRNIHVTSALRNQGISRVAIWGKGNICDILIDNISEEIEIVSIVESRPGTDTYRGIKVVDAEGIPESAQMIIIIPVYDFDKITARIAESKKDCRIVGIDRLLDDILKTS